MKRYVTILAAATILAGCGGATMADAGSDSGEGTDASILDVAIDVSQDAASDSATDHANEASSDAQSDGSACVPLSDSPQRGISCTVSGDCPAGYSCLQTGGGKTCEVDCSVTSCACPTGLGCEQANYDGGTSHICS